MAPKPIRTPRSLRARQSQDPGGTRKDKKPPVPGLKEHSNPYAKGTQQKITNMEKDARNSVPTMFASMMRIKQMPPEKVARDSQSSVPGVDCGQVSVADGPAETPLLDLIYRTMVQNHEQAQRESRKVKSANRQLQLSIKKVVKSCQDIGTRIASMETRTEELETEVRAATAQTTTQGQQISDIQWKLEDAENRQRRNNLRILGIVEDLEGQDTRAYIVSLFKKAFPDLTGWDWEKEIQRAHRFPLMRKKQTSTTTGRDHSYPQAIIVYFGNFLLRQAVFERTRSNSKLMVGGVSYYRYLYLTLDGGLSLTLISPCETQD
ncbi:hypothetical protein NDU88_007154 [Pleurodeles waltl]|uniref:Uncharacterized protein n=1 Tax=Pleurodeles waltl TaxID=8319 RepID=A0AAV7VRT5_PLEWA|nr:hypothetical protein NDU88_007154 [Pleurodeles waltl]